MKKHSICGMAAMSAMCVFLMTGCSGDQITINNEQNDIIANYAARVIVKSTKVDFTYTPDIKEPQKGASDDNIQETETDADGNVIEVKHDYSSFSDYLNVKGIEISYKDCVVADEYPNDDDTLFVVEAEPGEKLVAVEYSLTNTTDSDISYSIPDNGLVFRLRVNDSKSVMSFKTLLFNDFSNMKNFVIGAGETRTAVIVFQVDESDAQNLSTIDVRYGEGGSSMPKETR